MTVPRRMRERMTRKTMTVLRVRLVDVSRERLVR